MGQPQLPALLVAHHRPGFYMRVITEGQVQAGDEIVRTRRGKHSLSVADVDALLYLPGHDADQLRAAVDIAALSPGWHESFQIMLESASSAPATLGVEPAGWVGFQPLVVRDVVAESETVTSITLAGADGGPLPLPRPGQYLTIRVPGAGDPAPVRNYSLSGQPGREGYRISVKRETHGLVSSYLQAKRDPWSPRRGRRPAWRVRLGHRHQPGAAHLRGHRSHAGAGDAARARSRAQRPRGVVDPHDSRRATPMHSPPRPPSW